LISICVIFNNSGIRVNPKQSYVEKTNSNPDPPRNLQDASAQSPETLKVILRTEPGTRNPEHARMNQVRARDGAVCLSSSKAEGAQTFFSCAFALESE